MVGRWMLFAEGCCTCAWGLVSFCFVAESENFSRRFRDASDYSFRELEGSVIEGFRW